MEEMLNTLIRKHLTVPLWLMCCFQRTGKEEKSLLLKSWQVGFALALHCCPAQLCLDIRDWPAAQTQLERARKGQGQWTLARILFLCSVKGSAKQPESPEPSKFQWGKGEEAFVEVWRGARCLDNLNSTSGAISWAYESGCLSACICIYFCALILHFLCFCVNDSCQHRLLKVWGSMHKPGAVQGQVVWILCKDIRLWHLHHPIQTSKLKCYVNCSTIF